MSDVTRNIGPQNMAYIPATGPRPNIGHVFRTYIPAHVLHFISYIPYINEFQRACDESQVNFSGLVTRHKPAKMCLQICGKFLANGSKAEAQNARPQAIPP